MNAKTDAAIERTYHPMYLFMIAILLGVLIYMIIERKDVMDYQRTNTQLRCIGGLVHNPIGQLLRDEKGRTMDCNKYANVTNLKYE